MAFRVLVFTVGCLMCLAFVIALFTDMVTLDRSNVGGFTVYRKSYLTVGVIGLCLSMASGL